MSRHSGAVPAEGLGGRFPGILEGITVTNGPMYNQKYNSNGTLASYNRTDLLVANDQGSESPQWDRHGDYALSAGVRQVLPAS